MLSRKLERRFERMSLIFNWVSGESEIVGTLNGVGLRLNCVFKPVLLWSVEYMTFFDVFDRLGRC